MLAPIAATRPALSAPAVAIIVAPRCAASWTSMVAAAGAAALAALAVGILRRLRT